MIDPSNDIAAGEFSTALTTKQRTLSMKRRLSAYLKRTLECRVEFESPAVFMGDVVAFEPDGTTWEYEIKVARSNLIDELTAVDVAFECVKAGVGRYERVKQLRYPGITEVEAKRLVSRYLLRSTTSKYEKHEFYLNPHEHSAPSEKSKPTYFSFAVQPQDVVATMRRIAGTPYGCISIDLTGTSKATVMKQPIRLT